MIKQTQGLPEPRTYAGVWVAHHHAGSPVKPAVPATLGAWGDFRPTWMWLGILLTDAEDTGLLE